MLAKMLMVGVLALLCLTALVVTRASYADHADASASDSVHPH